MGLRTLDEFATNENYPAGGDPWSGNANKVAPGGAKNANGYTPNEPLPAPELNHLLNGTIKRARFQTARATFSLSGLTPGGANAGPGVYVSVPPGDVTGSIDYTGWYYVTQDSDIRVVADPQQTVAPTIAHTGLGNMNSIAAKLAGANSVIVAVGGVGSPVSSSLNLGGAWTNDAPINFFSPFNDVSYDPGNDLFIAVGDGEEIQTRPAASTVWTQQMTGGPQNFNTVTSAPDGKSLIVGTNGAVWTSTDGVNWTDRTVAAAGTLAFGIYEAERDEFLVFDNVGGSSGELRVWVWDGVGALTDRGQIGERLAISAAHYDPLSQVSMLTCASNYGSIGGSRLMLVLSTDGFLNSQVFTFPGDLSGLTRFFRSDDGRVVVFASSTGFQVTPRIWEI